MAEFYDILPSLSAVSIANRGGGWDRWLGGVGWGGVGWGGVGWEVAKTPIWDTPLAAMIPTQWPMTHSGLHSQWEQTQVPLPNWHPPWVPFFLPWLWRAGKIPLRKADQLTLTLDTQLMDRYWVCLSTVAIKLNSVLVQTTYTVFC